MKIVIVSTFYSEGMGYTENCLPRYLASLGHDVIVLTSTYNVYGDSEEYEATYSAFLGVANQGEKFFNSDGYTVHRLKTTFLFGYPRIIGLIDKIKELNPDIVHCTEIASFQMYSSAFAKLFCRFKLFSESHQHLSVIKPYLKTNSIFNFKKWMYFFTRTVPTFCASIFVEKCYAIAPDCLLVANKYYGVPLSKLKLQSLGSDTERFKPVTTEAEKDLRRSMRAQYGFTDADIVCVYTGRFSQDKNPLILANAIEQLVNENLPFHGLFVGEGGQKEGILGCKNTKVLSFMTHKDLADLYRMVDIAVWPRQESMSMLDAVSSGLPLIVSDQIGEMERVKGNGLVYEENSLTSLVFSLKQLINKSERDRFGAVGRKKVLANNSWGNVANNIANDFASSLKN